MARFGVFEPRAVFEQRTAHRLFFTSRKPVPSAFESNMYGNDRLTGSKVICDSVSVNTVTPGAIMSTVQGLHVYSRR